MTQRMSSHDTIAASVMLDSGRSGGAIGIVEVSLPPRWDGPPLHHHTLANLGDAAAPAPEALKPYPETVVVGPTIFERLGRPAP